MFKKKEILGLSSSMFSRKQYKVLRSAEKDGIDVEYLRKVADPKFSEMKMRRLITVRRIYRFPDDINKYLFEIDDDLVIAIIYIARAFSHGITEREITSILYGKVKSPSVICAELQKYTQTHSRGVIKEYLKYATFNEEDIDSEVKGEIIDYED
jgi:hypothetical protein